MEALWHINPKGREGLGAMGLPAVVLMATVSLTCAGAAAGLQHLEPIWGEPPHRLLQEFISSGGRAVITCVDLAKLDEAWLGRVIDERFASEIGSTGADACGENGEYHSFAFAGPVFTKPLTWTAGERRLDSGFAQLDLTNGA